MPTPSEFPSPIEFARRFPTLIPHLASLRWDQTVWRPGPPGSPFGFYALQPTPGTSIFDTVPDEMLPPDSNPLTGPFQARTSLMHGLVDWNWPDGGHPENAVLIPATPELPHLPIDAEWIRSLATMHLPSRDAVLGREGYAQLLTFFVWLRDQEDRSRNESIQIGSDIYRLLSGLDPSQIHLRSRNLWDKFHAYQGEKGQVQGKMVLLEEMRTRLDARGLSPSTVRQYMAVARRALQSDYPSTFEDALTAVRRYLALPENQTPRHETIGRTLLSLVDRHGGARKKGRPRKDATPLAPAISPHIPLPPAADSEERLLRLAHPLLAPGGPDAHRTALAPLLLSLRLACPNFPHPGELFAFYISQPTHRRQRIGWMLNHLARESQRQGQPFPLVTAPRLDPRDLLPPGLGPLLRRLITHFPVHVLSRLRWSDFPTPSANSEFRRWTKIKLSDPLDKPTWTEHDVPPAALPDLQALRVRFPPVNLASPLVPILAPLGVPVSSALLREWCADLSWDGRLGEAGAEPPASAPASPPLAVVQDPEKVRAAPLPPPAPARPLPSLAAAAPANPFLGPAPAPPPPWEVESSHATDLAEALGDFRLKDKGWPEALPVFDRRAEVETPSGGGQPLEAPAALRAGPTDFPTLRNVEPDDETAAPAAVDALPLEPDAPRRDHSWLDRIRAHRRNSPAVDEELVHQASDPPSEADVPPADDDAAGDYYTPDEIRAMRGNWSYEDETSLGRDSVIGRDGNGISGEE